MFKGLSNFAGMMRQAQEFQSKMGDLQESLKDLQVTGEAGAGMVRVTANGQQQILACQIDPTLLASGDRDLLEELVVSATNQALDKSREASAEKMTALTDGLNIPGLQDAISRMGQS